MDRIGTLYYLVSLPAGGKDYFYENTLKNLGCHHVSSDLLRREMFGDINCQDHNVEVFEELGKRVRNLLKKGEVVCFNSTGLSSKRRSAFLKTLSGIPCNKICIVLATPYEKCLERNLERDRHVPKHVIMRMLKNFEVPTYEEGWNDIKIYGYQPDDTLELILEEMRKIDHDNHHHQLTIGEHMLKTESYYLSHFSNIKKELILACRYHDISKGIVKTFTNFKGELTNEAHYFNHENVSAYLFLSHSPVDTAIQSYLYIANLIQYHMSFFKGEKYLEKIDNKFGEQFMSDLRTLHNCDIKAH